MLSEAKGRKHLSSKMYQTPVLGTNAKSGQYSQTITATNTVGGQKNNSNLHTAGSSRVIGGDAQNSNEPLHEGLTHQPSGAYSDIKTQSVQNLYKSTGLASQ